MIKKKPVVIITKSDSKSVKLSCKLNLTFILTFGITLYFKYLAVQIQLYAFLIP